jgi:hypothetical protein
MALFTQAVLRLLSKTFEARKLLPLAVTLLIGKFWQPVELAEVVAASEICAYAL